MGIVPPDRHSCCFCRRAKAHPFLPAGGGAGFCSSPLEGFLVLQRERGRTGRRRRVYPRLPAPGSRTESGRWGLGAGPGGGRAPVRSPGCAHAPPLTRGRRQRHAVPHRDKRQSEGASSREIPTRDPQWKESWPGVWS